MLKKIRKQPQFDNTLTKLNNTLFRHAFSSVQLLSHGQLLATPWITARQASLSITNSQSSLRLMSIESVMPSSHQILCHPLLLMPLIPPSIRFFSNESTLRMRWPKYWSFSMVQFSKGDTVPKKCVLLFPKEKIESEHFSIPQGWVVWAETNGVNTKGIN